MATYALSQREIPLHCGYDVIVVGGGPAGCAAAIASAEQGAKTLLLESTGALGGMATSGLVPAWCPYSDGERVIYRGISQRVFETLKAQMPHVKPESTNWVPIDGEKLKRIYDDMVTEAGAEVLFFSLLSGVETDGDGNVTALLVSNKSGLSAYQAKMYIDCTGDGDLAVWAGAEYHQGDEVGEVQPATLCFTMSGVNEYAYLNGPILHTGVNPQSPFLDMLGKPEYPHLSDRHMCQNLVSSGRVGFNANHLWNVYPDQPRVMSEAMIEGRKIAWDIQKALKECHPAAFGGATVAQTAALMGIRETRRIVGDYTLVADDYYARRDFPDEICRCCYYIDMHGNRHEQKTLTERQLAERSARYGKGESYGVPYRTLTPKGLHNVLVAGRCISADRAVQASVRIMPACMTTGEAAGIAAHLALSTGDVHKVPTDTLRDILLSRGAYIH